MDRPNETFDGRDGHLLRVSPGNESCAVVNESMFEEQKTDNNINMDKNINVDGN